MYSGHPVAQVRALSCQPQIVCGGCAIFHVVQLSGCGAARARSRRLVLRLSDRCSPRRMTPFETSSAKHERCTSETSAHLQATEIMEETDNISPRMLKVAFTGLALNKKSFDNRRELLTALKARNLLHP